MTLPKKAEGVRPCAGRAGRWYLNPGLLLHIALVRFPFVALATVLLVFADALHVVFVVITPAAMASLTVTWYPRWRCFSICLPHEHFNS
jgi:hypothetical protein